MSHNKFFRYSFIFRNDSLKAEVTKEIDHYFSHYLKAHDAHEGEGVFQAVLYINKTQQN